MRTVSFLLAIVFGLTGCNHLLYPADRLPYVDQKKIIPTPEDLLIPVADEEPACAVKNSCYIHAWYFKTTATVKKGVAVHFHGNGQNLTTHFLFFKWLTEFGYDYVIFDYRGYGASSDEKASTEKTVQDGVAVLKYAANNFKGPVFALGQSLGSNVLLRSLQDLNTDEDRKYLPAAVVLDSSFMSYVTAASSALSQRWFLYPLKAFSYLFLSDRYSGQRTLEKTPHLPAVFFHGTDDQIVHLELGQKNFRFWPGPKVWNEQPGGGHTSAFGDRRFSAQSRTLLLGCLDAAAHRRTAFEDCAKDAASTITK